MPTIFEDEITESLHRRAGIVDVDPRAGDAWALCETTRRRSARKRAAVTAMCSVAVLIVGASAVVNRPKPTTDLLVADQPAQDLRLVPSPLPAGAVLSQSPDVSASIGAEDNSTTSIWRGKGQTLMLVAGLDDVGIAGPLGSLDEVIERAKLNGYLSGQSLVWSAGKTVLALSAWPAMKSDDLTAIARTVTVNPDGRATLVAPKGLTDVFEGTSRLLKTERWWNLVLDDHVSGGGPQTMVTAQLPSSMWRDVYANSLELWAPQTTDAYKVTVRATTGLVNNLTTRGADGTPVPSPTQFVVTWEERGWILNVFADSEREALAIAESLHEPTADVWRDLDSSADHLSVEERRKPVKLEAESEIGPGRVQVRAGRLVTDAGCVNLRVVYTDSAGRTDGSPNGSPDDNMCVKPSGSGTGGSDLLWSGVREIAGQRALVAIVGVRVDAVDVITESGVVDRVSPEGISFDNPVPNSSSWVGLVVAPLSGASGAQLDLLADGNYDRLAPSAEAHEGDPDPVVNSDEEYVADYRSLGRFSVSG